MLQIFITKGNNTVEIAEFQKGCWINLVDPSSDELGTVSSLVNIEPDVLSYPLDEEERSRIEHEENYVLVLVDVPVEDEENSMQFSTLPLGMFITANFFITVCLRENAVLRDFAANKSKGFYTYKKTRFVFQLLFTIATTYLKYLKLISKKTDETERELIRSLRNKEFFTLLRLEKSLVYFTTSITANEIVLEKLLRLKVLPMFQEDEDLLEDVIVENKQAIEMVHIYSSILSGMMDAFASVISNNLNIVMKLLTAVTIILTIPTMIFSFYGMNVRLPFQGGTYAYIVPLIISTALSMLAGVYMAKRRIF